MIRAPKLSNRQKTLISILKYGLIIVCCIWVGLEFMVTNTLTAKVAAISPGLRNSWHVTVVTANHHEIKLHYQDADRLANKTKLQVGKTYRLKVRGIPNTPIFDQYLSDVTATK